jgi:hypothetical protein
MAAKQEAAWVIPGATLRDSAACLDALSRVPREADSAFLNSHDISQWPVVFDRPSTRLDDRKTLGRAHSPIPLPWQEGEQVHGTDPEQGRGRMRLQLGRTAWGI